MNKLDIETKGRIENWKDKVVEKQKHQVFQLKKIEK